MKSLYLIQITPGIAGALFRRLLLPTYAGIAMTFDIQFIVRQDFPSDNNTLLLIIRPVRANQPSHGA